MGNKVFVGPAQDKVDVSEYPASEAILPGQVLVHNATNTEFDLAGADQAGVVYFADTKPLENRDDAYAVGETCFGFRPSSGQYYDLVLADAQTIAKDAALTTDASGNLVALGGGANTVCYAAEAKTTSGGTDTIRVYVK